MFDIVYHPLVVSEDIPKLSTQNRQRIRRAIEQRLKTQPNLYGKPLRRSLKGCRKLRVGDYRVVFRIQGNKVTILVIKHRSVVYDNAAKRL